MPTKAVAVPYSLAFTQPLRKTESMRKFLFSIGILIGMGLSETFAQTGGHGTRIGPDQLIPALTQAGVLVVIPNATNPGQYTIQIATVQGCTLTQSNNAPTITCVPNLKLNTPTTSLTQTTFALPSTPVAGGAIGCYRNGLHMVVAGEFTLSGATVTVPAAQVGDQVNCDYISQ